MKTGYAETARLGQPRKLVQKEFEDLPHLIDHIRATDPNTPTGERTSEGIEYGLGWYGTKDLDSAIHLALYGWTQGREQIQKYYDTFRHAIKPAQQPQWQLTPDPAGIEVNMGAYVNGEPDDMWQAQPDYENTKKGNKFIHFVVNIGTSCTACDTVLCMYDPVKPKAIFQRGAALAALVDILEQEGKRCMVTVVAPVRSYRNNGYYGEGNNYDLQHTTSIVAKNYEDHLNIDELTFTLAHAAMFRRLILATQEREEPEIITQMGFKDSEFYGAVSELSKKELDELKPTVYIPAIRHSPTNWNTEKNVLKWVRDQLTACGLELEE